MAARFRTSRRTRSAQFRREEKGIEQETPDTAIRRETPADHGAIADVLRLAFGQDVEANLVAAIRTGAVWDTCLSLVAVRDACIVGHILFSPIHSQTDHGDVRADALAPMAVLPAHQRQGIGSILMREGLAACRRAGRRIVVVLGHPEYYRRFGFQLAWRHGVQPPFDVPKEAFMVQELVPGGLDGVTGLVRYPAVFDGV